jgi:stage III sporulation protein AF
MIGWLSGWLKEIVLIILLASFVDLLLPNNSFQRYVRTVLGLFIILALLTPFLTLFRQHWDEQKLVATVESLNQESRTLYGTTATAMRPLSAIMQEAERLRQGDQAETVRLMEQQLATELQKTIGGETNARVKRVSVQVATENDGSIRMKQMQVVLDDIESLPADAKPTDTEQRSRPIAKIEPVMIDIQAGVSKPKPNGAALTSEQQKTKQRVYDLLNRQWQLSRDQVTLVYEAELTQGR